MIITIVVFLLFFFWVGFSIKVVGPSEMAIYVFFGRPAYFVNSGIVFAPLLPRSGLRRYPKTLFNLDYPAQKIITRAGTYKSQIVGQRGREKAKEYGKQLIEIDAVVYMRFPQIFKETLAEGLKKDNASLDQRDVDPEKICIGLKKIIEQDIPKDKESLKEWTRDTVAAALRSVFGEVTWVEATENLKDLREKLKNRFSDKKNALTEAGFAPVDLDIEIQEIRLDKRLEKLLQEPDQRRLEAEAAVFTARRQAAEQVGSVVEAFALARGKSVKAIQKELNDDVEQRKEFLSYIKNINLRLEEADRNALIDIRVGDGNGDDRGDFLGSIVKAIAASKLVPSGEKDKDKKKDEKEKTEEKEEREEKEEKTKGKKENKEERKERIMNWLKKGNNKSSSQAPQEWREWEEHKKKEKK
jgi:hypothetical protein